MLLALQFRLGEPLEIIIVTPSDRTQASAFMDVVRRTYVPNVVVSVVAEGEPLRSAIGQPLTCVPRVRADFR